MSRTPQTTICRGWYPIHGEIKYPVLVTNNITALDAFGRMSHVWLAEYVHAGPYVGLSSQPPEDKGDYYTLDGPCFLTHYHEIPQAMPQSVRVKHARQQKAIRTKQNQEVEK